MTGNGEGRTNHSSFITYNWLVGVLVLLVVSLTAAWANALNSRISEVEDTHVSGNQRLTALETQYTDIYRRLGDIEGKLDSVLGIKKTR